MTQYGFFNQNGSVILVCVVHFWNFVTNKREGVSHFMITDDLKKTNMQVCQFIQDIFKIYDDLHFQHSQQHLNTLSIFSDNCGYQFKSRLDIFMVHACLHDCASLVLFKNIPNNLAIPFRLPADNNSLGWLTLWNLKTTICQQFCITFQLHNMGRDLRTLKRVLNFP